MCAAGRNGLKGGAGFYDYKSNSRVPEDADKANQIIKSWVDKQKVVHSIDMSDEDIKERCLYALINEAVNILHEGIALRGSDVDVIYVYGYGWPPYYGGPMWYADQIGLKNVYECIKKFKAQDLKAGRDLWHISPLWQTLIDANKKLSTYQSR